MKVHTIILFSAVLFAAIYVSSAGTDDDDSDKPASKLGDFFKKLAEKKGKGGDKTDAKSMIDEMTSKLKEMVGDGSDMKDKMKTKVNDIVKKLKELKNGKGSDKDMLKKAGDAVKELFNKGKGKDNSNWKDGFSKFFKN